MKKIKKRHASDKEFKQFIENNLFKENIPDENVIKTEPTKDQKIIITVILC